MQVDVMINHIGQLLPMDRKGPAKGEAMKQLEVQENVAIGIKDGDVVWIGSNADTNELDRKRHV